MESSRCRQCGAATDAGDVFCANCGAAQAPVAPRGARWGRRPAVALILVLLAGTAVIAGLTLRASAALGAIQSLSPPPASLPGTALGRSGTGEIDTAPARLAMGDDDLPTPAADETWWESVQDAVSGVPATVSGVAVAAGGQPAPPAPMTILLLGVDARPGEAIDVGVRADAILLLHLDPESRSCRLLAIPRDTRAELPGYGQSKINHALAVGGVPYQIQVVEQYLGLDIDRFALADFRAFAIVVDAIGGVTITVTEPFTVGDFTFTTGEHGLTGDQALAYARYRGGADGDFGRIARQQHLLRAIAEQASGLDLVRGISGILLAIEQHIRTDLTPVEISGLIAYYQGSCGADSIEMRSLSGETATFPDPLVGQELSYVLVADADKAAGVDYLLGE